ncbi:excinuclease ABC subunit UvrA [Pedobacter sp.]|jgi:excinuclease UvrABC ATPase subunit|uniref:excinuclease ABC subunit UvrA n=1 Tax=Pedobacter sp. TaxID=1411316 RepID=UPI002D1542C3|nr:excinuclease ABC subunit UvrA [Pedobacter sp.]HWW40962.1 excinuclease ABC subunit UvrA [Pedobacter sp.]
MIKYITITHAKQNNLKNISLKIPKGKLTVFTGISGSGKSSLVFDTIGAEAQRQINESESSFARMRMQHYGIPDVERIENLNVPVIINQKRLGGNVRSTVGTATDIYSSLRLLFSRMGKPFVGYSNSFSFNNPLGMCPECEGLGYVQVVEVDELVDKDKSLNEGAIKFATFQPGGWRLTRYVDSGNFDNDKKLKNFSKKEWDLLLYAEEQKPKHPTKDWRKSAKYIGLIPRIKTAFLNREIEHRETIRVSLEKVIVTKACPSCHGQRLAPKILSCKIKGKNIADCTMMTIEDLHAFISTLHSDTFDTILQEIRRKLQYVMNIGLQYLTLNRSTNTLSGGESQRIKMVRHLGNSLVDLLYIFDEPSIGLHPHDVMNIANIILKIRDKGNTVLLVEHDHDLIRLADHIVDMGPGAGKNGGKIVYQGDFAGLKQSKGLTGACFSEKTSYNKHPRTFKEVLTITKASLHNLKNISIDIPKGIFTVLTGVAGSGKSTLATKVLPFHYPQVTIIDQSLPAASYRSNLLTYLDLSDEVRKLFARANKVSDKLFSRNSEGCCPNCKGLGIEKIEMAFMDDIEQICDVCNGSGYHPKVLQYLYHEKNIAEIMEMTVHDAGAFFPKERFRSAFDTLIELGLDYLTLGQRMDSFSGGERQRLKLTRELSGTDKIIIIDEPSNGLHPSDTKKLLKFLNVLVDSGNTLIVIEHNPDIIAHADWVIDLGPGAGNAGGRVMFQGSVKDLLNSKKSLTANYLQNRT